ncbi:unnamed protein product [Arctogadus glacialis]
MCLRVCTCHLPRVIVFVRQTRVTVGLALLQRPDLNQDVFLMLAAILFLLLFIYAFFYLNLSTELDLDMD